MSKRKRASLTGAKAKESLGAMGLLAHIGQEETQHEQRDIEEIPLARLIPNPYQPRSIFDDHHIEELAESIKEHGFYGHLWARQKGRKLEIVYGERRLRAAKLAGLETLPVEIRELSDQQMLEIAITENVQRENLSPVEEAKAYQQLKNELSYTVRAIAQKIGKSVGYVSSLLSLLRYPEIQAAVEEHNIPVRTAEELAKIKDDDERKEMLQRVIDGEADRQSLIAYRKGEEHTEQPKEEMGERVRNANTPKAQHVVYAKWLRSLEKHDVETITDETREDTIQALEQLVNRASNMLEQLRS